MDRCSSYGLVEWAWLCWHSGGFHSRGAGGRRVNLVFHPINFDQFQPIRNVCKRYCCVIAQIDVRDIWQCKRLWKFEGLFVFSIEIKILKTEAIFYYGCWSRSKSNYAQIQHQDKYYTQPNDIKSNRIKLNEQISSEQTGTKSNQPTSKSKPKQSKYKIAKGRRRPEVNTRALEWFSEIPKRVTPKRSKKL